MKRFEIGMYGGKFMPFHKGHNYCIDVACRECERVYVILFYGGSDEEEILKSKKQKYLTDSDRKKHLSNICLK